MMVYPFLQSDVAKYNIKFVRGFIAGSHLGIDWAMPTGTPCRAIDNGVVYKIGVDEFGGRFIQMKTNLLAWVTYVHIQSDIWGTNYAGMSKGQVKLVNIQVAIGQVICYSDNTGKSTGAHLHLGSPVDIYSRLTFYNSDMPNTVHFPVSFVTKEKLGLYPQADNINPIATIPAGTRFDLITVPNQAGKDYFGNNCWLGVQFQGKYGWIPEHYVTYLAQGDPDCQKKIDTLTQAVAVQTKRVNDIKGYVAGA